MLFKSGLGQKQGVGGWVGEGGMWSGWVRGGMWGGWVGGEGVKGGWVGEGG